MIVVTNNQAKWESKAGDTIRQFFNQEFEVLPQSEPLFEMTHLPMAAFTDNVMFQSDHNIFIIDIDNNLKKASWMFGKMSGQVLKQLSN
jgi:hypothetical protein